MRYKIKAKNSVAYLTTKEALSDFVKLENPKRLFLVVENVPAPMFNVISKSPFLTVTQDFQYDAE